MHALRSRATAALGLAVICLGQLLVAPTVLGAAEETYIVLYKQEAVASDARTRVERAGGTFVASYPQIGVVIARSSSATFRSRLMADNRIDGVAATTKFGSKVSPVEVAAAEGGEGDLPNAPATDSDSLSGLQWDMMQIHTPEAHAITGGSPLVVVGDIDTGLDWQHPDLAPNIDFSRSVSCESGAPNQDPAAWDDRAGHGTHTAGTIAAAANGFGIVGVAPNVKIAGIKGSNDDGYFFPEMVICSFYWAGGGGFTLPGGGSISATVGPRVDVTNNSYFADPWLYNCRNDHEQHAIWKAEQRAIRFAQKNGVTVIASQGNDADDRAHPTVDVISPDFPPGSEQERRITNACVVIPLEISGVVGVTATGDAQQVDGDDDPNDYLKSYYSAYGVGVAELTAPGGDFYYGRSARAVNGLVLSTWPAELGCARGVRETPPAQPLAAYCYLQGTSMAGPHVAGVAALIISRYGDLKNPKNGKMSPGSVGSHLQQTAASQPCPTETPLSGAPGSSLFGVPYSAITRPDGTLQECQGGPGHNSWYGSGRVDALRAVLKDTGN